MQDMLAKIREIVDEHGLADWTIEVDNSPSRAGACLYNKRVLTFSKHFLTNIDIPFDGIKTIVLHEVAHALVGAQHGHDGVWRAKAIEIGSDGATYHQYCFYPPKAILSCPCGTVFKKMFKTSKKMEMWKNVCCQACESKVVVHSLKVNST